MNNTLQYVSQPLAAAVARPISGIKTIALLLSLLAVGCSTVEPPFLNPPLEVAARESKAQSGILMQEPNTVQKSTAFFQTPKPPVAVRNTTGTKAGSASATRAGCWTAGTPRRSRRRPRRCSGPPSSPRRRSPALPIEIMAGFEAFSDGAGAPVVPATRQALDWKGRRLFTPSAAEQAAICRRFGRPKDLARVALLEALI